MTQRQRLVLVSIFATLAIVLRAAPVRGDEGRANLSVVVKDAETGQPIYQAHLTLQFREPGKKLKPKLPQHLSYSAKTNPQGRYKFTNLPKGTVRLLVTADHHKTFGKEYELEKDNQVIEVMMKQPQPLI